jgi:hypothetical protein
MRQIIVTERDREAFIDRLRGFPLGKNRYVAEYKIHRIKRSLKANKLYWLWLRCIKDETGNDDEILHQYFRKRYLPYIVKQVFEEEVAVIPSTANLDSKQFSDYLEHIRVEMLEQGIFLPQPQEQGWDEFYVRYGLN